MKIVRPITIADSNLVSSNIAENDYPVYSSATNYVLKDRVIVTSAGTHKIYESLRGGSSPVTISFASPAVIGWFSHGLPEGTPITFNTTGTLPTGLTAGTTYYVKSPTTNSFNVAASPGGAAINTTSTGTGAHTAIDSPNVNHDPKTSPDYWLDCGATNRWRMFDSSVQSQSTNTTTLSTTIATTSFVDTVALLNLTGNSVRLVATHATFGVVYDQTIQLAKDEYAIDDWWDYFFADFLFRTDVLFEDIPLYSNLSITITVQGSTGATVGCGACVIGLSKDISAEKMGIELGAKIGIQDYSVKTRDNFGNYTILQRAFNKRADFTVRISNDELEYIQNMLASYRAVPIVYIGSSEFASTLVYGFYKSFDIDIAYHKYSICTIQLEGLT